MPADHSHQNQRSKGLYMLQILLLVIPVTK
uniref:Uncharacterized protein n=1 Tax=Manihot esculenta TaxID=3983 RepID=A0A199UBF8_MANES